MQEIREYAPVLIPTLNRHVHLKRCVESLARCTHADKTELVIGLDYPSSDKYREGWEKISEYVDTITGFKKVTILRAESNIGATENFNILQEYAKAHYQTFILSEDDNEFSPCFLDYIDKGLTKYWDDERITAICGYNYPVDMGAYDKNIYAHHQYSAWGVAFWSHKWQPLTATYANKILKSPAKALKVLRTEARMFYVLMSMVAQKQRWGDTLRVVHNIVENRYSIFPTLSLCRNLGHDGSGLHCGGSAGDNNNIYHQQQISDAMTFDFDDIPIREAKLPSLKRFFKIPLREKLYHIKLYIKNIIL